MAKYNSFEEMQVYRKSLQFGINIYTYFRSIQKLQKILG